MNINTINFVAENIFDELVLNEKISSEQKEKGQRIMQKLETNVFYRLKKQLEKDWEDKSVTKENLKKKKAEFDKLRELIKIGEHLKLSNDKETEKYLSKNSVLPIKWSIKKNDIQKSAGALDKGGEKYPTLKFSDVSYKNDNIPVDFKDERLVQNKDIERIIKTFAILHEYGHLYDYLYNIIKNGEAEITDTLKSFLAKNYKEIIDSEGKANAYAMDNIYRKDRLKLVNSDSYRPKQIWSSKLGAERAVKDLGGFSFSDLYRAGTADNSKKLIGSIRSAREMERDKIKKERIKEETDYFPY